jgi:hypothetical protein
MPILYDTATLIHVVRNLKIAQKFLLNKFFPNIVRSDTEYVAIDVEIGVRRMAPFVSPLVQGQIVEQKRVQTNQFKPAYLKPKTPVDVRKPVRRQVGERIGGELTGQQRAEYNIVEVMVDHIDQIDRRCEWMAASAMSTGTVTIEGDGFQTVVVDFGRDSALTLAKTGEARWTVLNIKNGTASPSSDIELWALLMLKKSGAIATDIVFTTSSWLSFSLDPRVTPAIYFPKIGESGSINNGAQITLGGQYKGRWGNYDLWVYNDWYVDLKGDEQPMLVDGTVLMSGPQLEGTRSYGMILDPEVNYQALEYAPKIWVEKDPAQTIIMTQSSPIMIPSRPNASLAAKVL